jgi:hypothetical protein
MRSKAVLAVSVALLVPAALSQCQGNGCPEQTRLVARPSGGTVIVPIRLPQEPASITEMTSSVPDLFAAGVVRNNGPRGITAVRIGWATIDKNGNFTEHPGQLIDMGWPRPLPKGTENYIANQAVPMVADDIVKVLFFVAQVDFVGGSSYTADLARLKDVALADNQRTGPITSLAR